MSSSKPLLKVIFIGHYKWNYSLRRTSTTTWRHRTAIVIIIIIDTYLLTANAAELGVSHKSKHYPIKSPIHHVLINRYCFDAVDFEELDEGDDNPLRTMKLDLAKVHTLVVVHTCMFNITIGFEFKEDESTNSNLDSSQKVRMVLALK